MAQLLFPQADEQARRDDPAGMNFNSLFKHRLTVVDEADKAWPVQYEGFMSSGQRHYRLTSGWSTLMRTQRVGIGDTLVLERWTRDRFVIHLRIVARPRPQPLPPPSRASSGRLEASRGEGY
ncbi:hypothetical protein H632_c2229p1 [Helicosporidium sp. ATCC 50920]|nr:hypothetical protein H632_c2229p1 [Helicosporidium sp. ATCC 50920]|eukprot:KDD73390.1 hypothetical protein H632_c2229p1 [Helicosporidium sp. ATCC 50920]